MKNFTKRDESFVCENCGKKVDKLIYSSRDHCPYCLCSKHVDKLPGDRAEDCKGILRPLQTIPTKDGFDIVYKCDKCPYINTVSLWEKRKYHLHIVRDGKGGLNEY